MFHAGWVSLQDHPVVTVAVTRKLYFCKATCITADYLYRYSTPADHYPIQDGAYIRGLFLEGARWDSEQGSLNDSRPKQLYTPLPVLHLDPEQHRKNPDKGVYRCPVYKVRTAVIEYSPPPCFPLFLEN